MSDRGMGGPPKQPTDDIEDAEFSEIDDLESGPPQGHMTLRQWWHGVHSLAKGALIIVALLGLAMCWIASLPAPNSSSEADIDGPISASNAAATGEVDLVAYLYNDQSSAGGTVMIDELPDSAAPVCDGEFIWTFDASDRSFHLGNNAADTYSDGHYVFDGQTLRLVNVVQKRGQDDPGKPSPDIIYRVTKGADGRFAIGKKSYRQCAATGMGGNDETAAQRGANDDAVSPAQRASIRPLYRNKVIPALQCSRQDWLEIGRFRAIAICSHQARGFRSSFAEERST